MGQVEALCQKIGEDFTMEQNPQAITISTNARVNFKQGSRKLREPLRLFLVAGGQTDVAFDAADVTIANQITEKCRKFLINTIGHSARAPLFLALRECEIPRRVVFRQSGSDRRTFANASARAAA